MDVSIARSATNGLRVVIDDVATTMKAGASHVTVDTTHAIANPIAGFGALAPGSAGQGLLRPHLLESTSRSYYGNLAGLNDAVGALHELATAHKIVGINLRDTAAHSTLTLAGRTYAEGGGEILELLGKGDVEAGRAIATGFHDAARRVMGELDAIAGRA